MKLILSNVSYKKQWRKRKKLKCKRLNSKKSNRNKAEQQRAEQQKIERKKTELPVIEQKVELIQKNNLLKISTMNPKAKDIASINPNAGLKQTDLKENYDEEIEKWLTT